MKRHKIFDFDKAMELSRRMNERPLSMEEQDEYDKSMGYSILMGNTQHYMPPPHSRRR